MIDAAPPVVFRPGPETLWVDNELTLQMATAKDGGRAHSYVLAQQRHYGEHLDYVFGYTLQQAKAAYRAAQKLIVAGRLFEYWMIAGGETVGNVGMSVHDDGTASLGYQVFAREQRKGYATRGARALLALAPERGVQLVELHIKPANKRSLGVARRLNAELMREQWEGRGGARALHQVWGVRVYGQD